MVRDAEANAEADKKRKEEVETRNEADQLVFQTEKTLKDLEEAGSIDQAELDKAESAKEELKTALEGEDIEDIKAKSDALSEIVQDLTVKLYEQAAAAQQAAEGADGSAEDSSDDDNIVDGEFEEADDSEDK